MSTVTSTRSWVAQPGGRSLRGSSPPDARSPSVLPSACSPVPSSSSSSIRWLASVLSPFGLMGGLYFAAAAVLGALFIRDALGLWRQATPQAARRLYLYSMLYLFALFAAMAVDRVVSATTMSA